MTPRIRPFLAALVALAFLAGCGDDDDAAADGDDVADVDEEASSSTSSTSADDDVDDGEGDGGEDGDEPATGGDEAFVQQAVDDLVEFGLEADMASCISTAVLDAGGGAERFREAGLDEETWFTTPESFEELGLPADDATVDSLADRLADCGDGYELLFTTGGVEVPDDVRQCVTEAIDEGEVRQQLAASIVRPATADGAEVFAVVDQCEGESPAG